MKSLALFVFSILIAAPAALAQKPPDPDKPPITTLTGCLRSSGADTAVAGPDGLIYTLEVTELPSPSAPATGTSSAPPVASKTTYSLSAPESVALVRHVDHQVQLTGRLQAPATPAAKTPSAPASKPKPGGAHRTFEVTALKMIAAKCEG